MIPHRISSLSALALMAGLIPGPAFSLDTQRLDQAAAAVDSGHYTGIDGILVYENGKVVSERYFKDHTAETLHSTRSTFKSVTGLLAALAFDQGILEPGEPLLPLLARYGHTNAVHSRRAAITVGDLLNMTSGLDCSEMPGTGPYHDEAVDNGPQPLKYSLAISMAADPGTVWKYCNTNSFLLGVAISAALDRAELPDIFHFAKKHLFDPLGIERYQIYRSDDGFLYAQGNARFLPRDLAKLGLLVLQKGRWQGSQLISEKHIDAILNGRVDTHWSWTDLIPGHPPQTSRYAYQWYRTTFAFKDREIPVAHTWGNGGQFVYVVPDLSLVVVFTGSNYGDIVRQKQAFEIMHRFILPSAIQPVPEQRQEGSGASADASPSF